MADSELDYAVTSGPNTDIGGVSVAEGIPPSNLNDAIRSMAALRALAITRHVETAASTHIASKQDHNQFWRFTGTGTVSFTPATDLSDGWCLWVKADGGDVTLNPSGSELINGSSSAVLSNGSSALVICTGAALHTVMTAASPITGTWTPAITGTSAAGSGTYSLRQGTYTRIGDRILFTINLVWSAHTGTGNMNITGLPFTSSSTMLSAVSVYLSSLTFAAAVQGVIANSSTTITLTTVATGGLATALPMDTAASIYVSGHYPI